MTASQPAAGGPVGAVVQLPELPRGRVGVILGVDGDDALVQQLEASGLWCGVAIERLATAPFGDPLLFRVHGYRLALRQSVAARVRVRETGA